MISAIILLLCIREKLKKCIAITHKEIHLSKDKKMITKTVEFEALKGKRKKVVEAIQVFTRAVHFSEPGSRIYVSLQDRINPDKFLHVMAFENEGAELIHQQAGYTREFVEIINRNCKKDPEFKEYEYLGGL